MEICVGNVFFYFVILFYFNGWRLFARLYTNGNEKIELDTVKRVTGQWSSAVNRGWSGPTDHSRFKSIELNEQNIFRPRLNLLLGFHHASLGTRDGQTEFQWGEGGTCKMAGRHFTSRSCRTTYYIGMALKPEMDNHWIKIEILINFHSIMYSNDVKNASLNENIFEF